MFTISHIKATDLEEVLALEAASFSSDAWTTEDFIEGMENRFDTLWVLRAAVGTDTCVRLTEQKGGCTAPLAGYCVLRIIGDEAEILNICVSPVFRRKGAGALMMQTMLAACRDAQVHAVWLEVRAHNAAARALYEKNGFQAAGLRKRYYQNPDEDAVVMCLKL